MKRVSTRGTAPKKSQPISEISTSKTYPLKAFVDIGAEELRRGTAGLIAVTFLTLP